MEFCSGYIRRHRPDGGGRASKVSEIGGLKIPSATIDGTVGNAEVTFIKMDIEGAEIPALQGAKQTILRCKPKLAVSVYHKPEDFVAIPKYIKSLRGDYKYYLRAYSRTGCETILYAI